MQIFKVLATVALMSKDVDDGNNLPVFSAADISDLGAESILDLDEIANKWATRHYCREQGYADNYIKWTDFYGKQKQTGLPYYYSPFRVIKKSEIQYQVERKSVEPALVLTQDYCNTLSSQGSFKFKKSSQETQSSEWTVSKGMSTSQTLSVNVGIPSLGSFSAGVDYKGTMNMYLDEKYV